MKRFTSTLLLAVACLLLHAATADSLLADGVSRALADMRKAAYHDVRYDLRFVLTADPQADIAAEETVRLRLDAPTDIVLDWRERPTLIESISIGGRPAAWHYTHEHIVIDKAGVQTGENAVTLRFTAGNQSLNRREGYLYTLFVPDRARTVFPCFDQPNLKASFRLTLDMPAAWQAVSNTYAEHREEHGDRATLRFAATEPLSTYLFAFAAGEFEHQTYTEDGRTIGAYYRETDPQRLAQLPEIFRQVMYSLRWLEAFTAMPYPFAKYDLVILPGFQFGGMEHTGATFYNDNVIFLPAIATPDEELARAEVISHETAHMWFGDAVTMDWFNDVWTKEVFANYFAAEITAPQFPDLNHRLNWLRTYIGTAIGQDRTEGATAIQQPLDNLRMAGLIYNDIIYFKAPAMLRQLVSHMGEDNFRRGIQRYVATYKYGNATWDDLVAILDEESPADVRAFSDVWVHQQGMPTITLSIEDGVLVSRESDPSGKGRSWPQQCESRVIDGQIYPNYDGRGYAFFTMDDEAQLLGLLERWQGLDDATARQASLMTLYENYLRRRLPATAWVQGVIRGLQHESDVLTASSLVGFLAEPLRLMSEPTSAERMPAERVADIEQQLWTMADEHPMPSVRTGLLRLLRAEAVSPAVCDSLYALWQRADNPLLSPLDYTGMAFELAVRYPDRAAAILRTERSRITNPDRLAQFDYIAPAVSADRSVRDRAFDELREAKHRRIEPWAQSRLYYLNHPLLPTAETVSRIAPALALLPEVQLTGDIFFPGRWSASVLAPHRSPEARRVVEDFLATHTDYPALLTGKIRIAMYGLMR